MNKCHCPTPLRDWGNLDSPRPAFHFRPGRELPLSHLINWAITILHTDHHVPISEPSHHNGSISFQYSPIAAVHSIKNIWRCVKSCSALKSPSCTAASVAQANLIIFMYIWWFTFVLLLLPSVDTCWVQFLVHCYMCSAKPLQIVPLEILSKSI